MKYTDLQLSIDDTHADLYLGDKVIHVKNYLPILTKSGIAHWVAENATDDYKANPALRDCYIGVAIARFYTDIEIPNDIPLAAIYDELYSSGVLDQIYDTIPQQELTTIRYYCDAMLDSQEMYNFSVVNAMNEIKDGLPSLSATLTDAFKDVDMDKLNEVMNVARAVGAVPMPAGQN